MIPCHITIIPLKAIEPALEGLFKKWCKHYNVSPNERGLGKDYDLIKEYCVIDTIIKLIARSDSFVMIANNGSKSSFSKAIKSVRKALPHRIVDFSINKPAKYDVSCAPGEIVDQLLLISDNGVHASKMGLFWREKFPILAEKTANDANFRRKLCETR